MATSLDVLAGPGRVLIEDYAGGREGRHEYYSVVTRIYLLLNRMHDEVLDQLTEARLTRNRVDATEIMRALLDPDFLTRGFRAQELCDELEKQGRALINSGHVRPGSETAELVDTLAKRERASAEFYVRELEPDIRNALSAQSFPDLQSGLTAFRDKLVEQQAAFMEQAEEAVRRAGE